MSKEERCGLCAHWESFATGIGRCQQTVTIENDPIMGQDITAWAETTAEIVNTAVLITRNTHNCSMFSGMSIYPKGWCW